MCRTPLIITTSIDWAKSEESLSQHDSHQLLKRQWYSRNDVNVLRDEVLLIAPISLAPRQQMYSSQSTASDRIMIVMGHESPEIRCKVLKESLQAPSSLLRSKHYT
ncbi:hypothetical protein E4U53_007777 [Claviceps sorghi]|nr:hypothetical protein E4U53_007777 [Claviceps sorghi]